MNDLGRDVGSNAALSDAPLRGTRVQNARPPLALFVVGAGMTLASLAVSPGLQGAFGAALGLSMLAVAWTDSRRFIVPDALSGGAFALGILAAIVRKPDARFESLLTGLASAAFVAGLFLLIRVGYRVLRGREGLGLGDVKLAAAAGAWLSLTMLPVAVEIAAVSGLAAYLWRQRKRRRVARATARIPFGAFFALAIWVGWVLDARLADWG